MLLSDLLDAAAERRPQGEALVDLGTGLRLSYQQVAARAGSLAAALAQRGLVAPRQRVGLHLPNSAAYVVSFHALMRLGATAVPMNPLYKPDELAYILGDAGLRTVVTAAPLLPGLQAAARDAGAALAPVVAGADGAALPPGALAWEEAVAAAATPPARPAIAEDDVATCLYTSGTTGRPKGTQLTHGNLTFDVGALLQRVSVGPEDRMLCVLPLFHSFSQMACLIAPTAIACTVVLLPRFRPAEVLETIARERITIFLGVPAMYAALLASTRGRGRAAMGGLRLAVSGGAPLPLEILEGFERGFGVTILEGNGPTEAGPVSYVNPERGPRKPGSVGPPLPGVEVAVVDPEGRPVPTGTPGEVLIRGPNVMKGYLGQPELTAATLRGGWLHTGDLGRVDEDGYVFLLDRIKDLIKVGGLNVYPREVEEALLRHPAVADAAVVGRPNRLRGEDVVAFVVAQGEAPSGGALLAHCRTLLANFKCPRHVIFCEALPRNAAGKVRKDELRRQAADPAAGGEAGGS